MTCPPVSIVMPTFNRAWTIRTAIDSVLEQTFADFELLVIDDGSTDQTAEIVAGIDDSRIRYKYQPNQGRAVARNNAFEIANGEWIAYLDSDNELFPTYLDVMLQALDGEPGAVFAVPRARRLLELYEDGELVCLIDDSKDTPSHLSLDDIFMKRLHLDTNGFIHHRSVFDEGIRWDPNCPAMEDWDLAMTIGERHPKGFMYVSEVLYTYHQRYGGDGIVSSFSYGDWADVFEYIYRKHRHSPQLSGQTWYPDRVEKWQRLQREYEQGLLPPYTHYYFRQHLT